MEYDVHGQAATKWANTHASTTRIPLVAPHQHQPNSPAAVSSVSCSRPWLARVPYLRQSTRKPAANAYVRNCRRGKREHGSARGVRPCSCRCRSAAPGLPSSRVLSCRLCRFRSTDCSATHLHDVSEAGDDGGGSRGLGQKPLGDVRDVKQPHNSFARFDAHPYVRAVALHAHHLPRAPPAQPAHDQESGHQQVCAVQTMRWGLSVEGRRQGDCKGSANRFDYPKPYSRALTHCVSLAMLPPRGGPD